jgi:hypothetical protein
MIPQKNRQDPALRGLRKQDQKAMV